MYPPKLRRSGDPSAPAFDLDACEFRCATPDCGEGSHDADDLAKCEACSQRFCSEHLTAVEDLKVCAECFKCAVCGQEATAICGNCGDFICPSHLQEYHGGIDPDTGYADEMTACAGCMKSADRRAA